MSGAHYQKIVYWSEEDQCFIGTCPALFLGGVHGDDEAKVYKEIVQVVDDVLAGMKADGSKLPPADLAQYSGKLTLRIDPALHRALSVRAKAAGDPLSGYIRRTLAEAIGCA